MKDKEYIQVTITKEEIRTRLKKMLGSEHSDLISQVIIDNLSVTEVGLSQLYRAFIGLKEEYKYKVGEKVWVNKHALYTWRMDEERMKKASLMHQDKVICTIKEIIKTNEKPYTVKYSYIDSSGNPGEDTSEVPEKYIHPADEYPINQ